MKEILAKAISDRFSIEVINDSENKDKYKYSLRFHKINGIGTEYYGLFHDINTIDDIKEIKRQIDFVIETLENKI